MSTQLLTNTPSLWADQRRELQERRAELVAAGLRGFDDEGSAQLGTLGETEHLAAYEQRHLDAALDAMQQRELADIDVALARMDDGTYGSCAGCGNDIAPERLSVLPTASTCVGCAGTLN